MESTKDVCGEAEGRPEREQQRYLQGRLQVASKSLAICRVSVFRNVMYPFPKRNFPRF